MANRLAPGCLPWGVVVAASPELARALALRAAMQDLANHPAWETYSRELEDIEHRLMERLVHADAAEIPHVQGQIVGLRAAYDTPRRLIDSAK